MNSSIIYLLFKKRTRKMIAMTRIRYTYKNFLANSFHVVLALVNSFAVRTVFIYTLGKEYLGISGLFGNILSLLTLAELGIGTAIAFKLYKPLAEKDKNRIAVLMNFYKSAYQVISAFIMVTGLLILPFLKYIIKDNVDFVNINLVFLIFLIQTASSYMFFAYKSTLIIADQRQYVVIRIGYKVETLSSLVQIVILVIFRNYIYYISSVVLFNLAKNLIIARRVDKDYSYIKHATKEKLSKYELKEMFKDFGSLFLYKINSVVIKATDNILISVFVGLATVGLYSNYLLITSALKKIIDTFYSAVKASIGNLHATSDVEHEYFIFNVINQLTALLFGGAAIGIVVISDTFIRVWIGDEYVISSLFALLLAIEFYLRGMQLFLSQFRTSMGLFQQAKLRPVFGMAINLIVSLVLVQYIGVYGVLIGTIVASLTTYMWFDPIIIHKYGFNMSSRNYFIRNLYYLFIVLISGFLSFCIVNIVQGESFIYLIVKIILYIIISGLTFMVFLIKTRETQYLLKKVAPILLFNK